MRILKGVGFVFACVSVAVVFALPVGLVAEGSEDAEVRPNRETPFAASPQGAMQPGRGDWGDAPEGAPVYPPSLLTGAFPTCFCIAPPGYIIHGPQTVHYFGLGLDFEWEGNGGLCPGYAPYDNDECYQDGDAGLLWPYPYTIYDIPPLEIHPCPNGAGSTLEDTCRIAEWGVDIDVWINAGQDVAYFNLLVDWDQNGIWGGTIDCPTHTVPEHVITDFQITAGFVGRLSGHVPAPPAIPIGPLDGYVWTRFTISPNTMGADWDGSHPYIEIGETEDYLLKIGGLEELGDAPEGEMAYPWGVIGEFPTCRGVALAGFIHHDFVGLAYFGDASDYEAEGNANQCYQTPPFPPYDWDECYSDGDAGLLFPCAYTLDPMGTLVPCVAGDSGAIGAPCSLAVWGQDVDIYVRNYWNVDAYVNVLFDWDQDGMWGGGCTCPNSLFAPEWVLDNFPVPAYFTGPLSMLGPPPFVIGPYDDVVWARFTISPTAVAHTDWTGDGFFSDGETEDYLIRVERDLAGTPSELPEPGHRLYENSPNPFEASTTIRYNLQNSQTVRLSIYDPGGRLVCTLVDGRERAGAHQATWEGNDSLGHPVSAGVYFYRMEAGAFSETRRMVLVR